MFPTRDCCTARRNPISPRFYIFYYSPTLPYIALILKGKECKVSSERAQGQRAAHKGRGSHLSTVVPLHICCRLPQRVTNPLSTGPIPLFLQLSALVTLFDYILCRHRLRCILTINCIYNRAPSVDWNEKNRYKVGISSFFHKYTNALRYRWPATRLSLHIPIKLKYIALLLGAIVLIGMKYEL